MLREKFKIEITAEEQEFGQLVNLFNLQVEPLPDDVRDAIFLLDKTDCVDVDVTIKSTITAKDLLERL